MRKFKMEILTNEMRDRVLKKMENEGITWASGGKVVCIDGCGGSFTKGRIYEIKNGKVVSEKDGCENCVRVTNVDELNHQFISKFIELVD